MLRSFYPPLILSLSVRIATLCQWALLLSLPAVLVAYIAPHAMSSSSSSSSTIQWTLFVFFAALLLQLSLSITASNSDLAARRIDRPSAAVAPNAANWVTIAFILVDAVQFAAIPLAFLSVGNGTGSIGIARTIVTIARHALLLETFEFSGAFWTGVGVFAVWYALSVGWMGWIYIL
jgi:hypothetical protein